MYTGWTVELVPSKTNEAWISCSECFCDLFQIAESMMLTCFVFLFFRSGFYFLLWIIFKPTSCCHTGSEWFLNKQIRFRDPFWVSYLIFYDIKISLTCPKKNNRKKKYSQQCLTGADVSSSPIFKDLKGGKSWTLKGKNIKLKIWNNPQQREVKESTEASMQTLFHSRPRWGETEVEKGVGKDIEERLAWRNKTPFSPPTPWPSHVTSWANKWSIQPGSQGKWLLGWALPNESRDACYYYCLHRSRRSRNADQISAGSCASFRKKNTRCKQKQVSSLNPSKYLRLQNFKWISTVTYIL